MSTQEHDTPSAEIEILPGQELSADFHPDDVEIHIPKRTPPYRVPDYISNVDEPRTDLPASPDQDDFSGDRLKKGNKKLYASIAAGIGVLGLGVGIGAKLTSGSEHPVETTSEQPSGTTINPPQTGASTPESNQTPLATSESGADKSYGNFNLADSVIGNNFVEATRPNGDVIKVPRLDDSSPQRLAETAMALLACSLTTGSNDCLNAFSESPSIQQGLLRWRQNDIVPKIQENTDRANLQVVIYDKPDDPAVFKNYTDNLGRETVELSSGTLYIYYYSGFFEEANKWQSENTRVFSGLESKFYTLSFGVKPRSDGNGLSVDKFSWDYRAL